MRQFTHLVLIGACIALGAPGVAVSSAQARQQNPGAADRLSDADLEELLAPIALYPDPLLANVLAACCYPDEVAQAARGGDPAGWEPSVQAVAKVPDALKMLTDYPDWTKAVGEAFILQSPDVMRAVQSLRARAYANGALQTSEQMVVQQQGDVIIIEPAQPEIIYVPSYNPSVVYVDHHDDAAAAGLIGFGLGITAGLIIGNNMDCDWHGGGCCYGCGWGHWGHGDVDIDIDVNNNTINNIKNNGNKWKANNTKISNDLRNGQATALNNYKGVGSANRATNARVPGRTAGSAPIASRPAPSASQAAAAHNRAVPTRTPAKPAAQPMNRPDSMNRAQAPKAKPSIPPASQRPPAARPTGANRSAGGAPQAQRPSAYSGGSQRQSAQRGASSRGSRSSGGGASRGGGGGGRRR